MFLPKTKLSGLKICPKVPERTESMVPGSRSTRMALGTYFPPAHTDKEQQHVRHYDHKNKLEKVQNIRRKGVSTLKTFGYWELLSLGTAV